VLGNPVSDRPLFIVVILLGGWGFASLLTLISGIASRAGNSTMLMAVLSFPVMIPLLLLILQVTGYAIDGLDRAVLNVVAFVMSWLLFPYLWKN
jgi:heme exporter protein B